MDQPTFPGISLQLGHDGSYIIARTLGEHTVASALAAAPALLEFIQTTGVMKVLVDSREQKRMFDTLAALDFAEDLKEFVIPRYRLSFVIATPISDAKFVETVLVNRGLTVRFFNDYGQALAWLGIDPAGAEDS